MITCKKSCKKAKKGFVNCLKDSDPKTWMKKIKNIGKANHEISDDNWQFIDEVKDNQALTEELADYFSNINSHMTPIDRSKVALTPPGASFVSEVWCFPSQDEIFILLKKSKQTCSVPNDIPIKILNYLNLFTTCTHPVLLRVCFHQAGKLNTCYPCQKSFPQPAMMI